MSWGEKTYFHNVIRCVDNLQEHDLLELIFDGGTFLPVLISERKSSEILGGEDEKNNLDPEAWWAGLPPVKRNFVREVDRGLVRMVMEDKVMQFRKIGPNIKISLASTPPLTPQTKWSEGNATLN